MPAPQSNQPSNAGLADSAPPAGVLVVLLRRLLPVKMSRLSSVHSAATSRATLHGDLVFSTFRNCTLVLLLAGLLIHAASAADRSLSPKYGSGPKDPAEQAADVDLFAAVDKQYPGDRKRAAEDAAKRGWKALRARRLDEAMRRFNQAWLIDPKNGSALWGMGAVQGLAGKKPESLDLFREAEPLLGDDLDFAVDYARTLGMAATDSREPVLVQGALDRFARQHQRAPQHTLNLQNWAVALFEVGRYAPAWEKIQLAQATPRAAELDARFVTQVKKNLQWFEAAAGGANSSAGTPPQLWSDHKRLALSEQACADKAYGALISLGFAGVVRKEYNVYGNFEGSRAAVKCVPLDRGSLVYFAVAGSETKLVERVRNAIAREF